MIHLSWFKAAATRIFAGGRYQCGEFEFCARNQGWSTALVSVIPARLPCLAREVALTVLSPAKGTEFTLEGLRLEGAAPRPLTLFRTASSGRPGFRDSSRGSTREGDKQKRHSADDFCSELRTQDTRTRLRLSKGECHMRDEQSSLRTDDILSQADIILPTQYYQSVGSVGLSGEQRLMLAVLVDAINVLQSWRGNGRAHKRRNFADAVQWVNARGTCHPFSFESVCDALEIDSELLRSHLGGLTVRPANSAGRPTLGRLRLKELSRSRHMSANRSRRREHVSRGMTTMTRHASEIASRWEVQEGQVKQCVAEQGTNFAPFDQSSTVSGTGDSVSC